MNRLLRLTSVFPVLCLTTLAQEPQAPASQLQKFQPFIGTWEGSGTFLASPEGPEAPWTSRETWEWVLGGHFVRQQVIVEFGEAMPGSLAFTSFLGWDNENGGYVALGASNLGEVAKTDVHFPSANTMVTARTAFMEGQPIVERTVIKLSDGTATLAIDLAVADGPFFTHVRGRAKKTSAARALAVDAAMPMAPPAPEMATLGKMAGEYEIKGSMIPAPGAPEMEVTGTEAMRLIMGGTVLESQITGEGGPDMPGYEAFGFMAWNPVDKCYDSISVDNMGMSGEGQFRFLDDQTVVATVAAVMYGQPTANRTLLKLDSEGLVASVIAHAIAGAGEPQRTFSATYRKIR